MKFMACKYLLKSKFLFIFLILILFFRPLEKDVSKWNYIIQASDSNGGNVSDDFEINVQHHKAKRTLTHEFIMKLRIEDKYNLPRPLDWQIRVLQGIRDLYKNENLDHILTRNVEILSDPVTFTWSNLSLPTDYCPIHDIKKLLAVCFELYFLFYSRGMQGVPR